MKTLLDDRRMTRWMHDHPEFRRVMHVAHHEWHGIRHATGYCPGRKLLIPADEALDREDHDEVERIVEAEGIDRVVFQAYSETADQLALRLRATFGDAIRMYVVTHVTTAQFDNYFEMIMQARLFTRLRYGTFDRLGSVKPRFSECFPDYWPGTILNYAPNVDSDPVAVAPQPGRVFVPLDVAWRKNIYTNILAALLAPGVEEVWTTNYPNGLESIADLRRLRLVGYLRGAKLLSRMAECWAVAMATLAECQPMTQLEAFAVGTPAVTGPLELAEFAGDELVALCEVDRLDSPPHIAAALGRLMDFRSADPSGCREMIRDHLCRRHALATERYAEFLDL